MKKIIYILVATAILGACSNVNKKTLGLERQAPDETMVTTRKPLSLPPEFDLRPVMNENEAKDEAKVRDKDEGLLDKLGSEQ